MAQLKVNKNVEHQKVFGSECQKHVYLVIDTLGTPRLPQSRVRSPRDCIHLHSSPGYLVVFHTTMDRCGRPGESSSEEDLELYLTKLCSDVTLYSPKEGFFNHYMEQIDAQVSQDFLDKFGQLKSDEDRLLKTWGVKPIHTLKVQSFYRQKSREVSECRREEGNKAFQEKKNGQALVLYSQAVVRAPHDEGKSLALALANRSAVLYHMDEYHLCLTDIDLAIQAGYPPNLMYKVLDRRGQCQLQLGQYNSALLAFTAAAHALATSGLDKKKLESWKKDLSIKIHSCQGKTDAGDPAPSKTTSAILFQGSSKVLPNASSALTLNTSKDEGRYLVARGPIPAGQVLIAERPYSAVLMDDKCGSHCIHCYHRLVAPVPCPWCSGVAFCSPRCRDLALATYHRWECKFLDLLKGSGVSLNCYLALRVITQHGLPYFKKVGSSMIPTFLMLSHDYHNFNRWVCLPLWQLSGMAFASGKINFKKTKSVFLGLAVYPTISYCNHSCFPAVTRYFEGDKMVIVSLRPLQAGDVVAENYGPIFTHHPRQERQRKLLSRYWFRCNCEACRGDWPVYNNMVNKRVIQCHTCKSPLPQPAHNQSHVTCKECGNSTNIVQADKTLHQANKLYVAACQHMDEGHREEAISSFTSFVDIVSGLVVPPFRELHLSMQALRLLIASRGTIHTPGIPAPDASSTKQ
nr:SET and MYND domain-containing protein 4-like [Cherax quadricarinatus]